MLMSLAPYAFFQACHWLQWDCIPLHSMHSYTSSKHQNKGTVIFKNVAFLFCALGHKYANRCMPVDINSWSFKSPYIWQVGGPTQTQASPLMGTSSMTGPKEPQTLANQVSLRFLITSTFLNVVQLKTRRQTNSCNMLLFF